MVRDFSKQLSIMDKIKKINKRSKFEQHSKTIDQTDTYRAFQPTKTKYMFFPSAHRTSWEFGWDLKGFSEPGII